MALRLVLVSLVCWVFLGTTAFALQPASPYPLSEPDYSSKRPLDFSSFAAALDALKDVRRLELDALVIEATIPELQAAFDAGRLTSEELVTYYIWRIREYDFNRFNSVMELNPEALEIARQRDAERAAGGTFTGMHGIPVLLKDNIAAVGDMHWTAGAWALRDLRPDRDAFLVAQLRAAGAIILGKANLSEWANWVDPSMPNGFSTLGGQTRNPYGAFDTFGSSSGSAVATAANFVSVSVGTETSGSIISPAGINSVVGLKASRGLVSRDYVIPLLEGQDSPGPMARSVTDVAILLTAMTGVDTNDPATQGSASLAGTDFAQFLTLDGIDQLRVGYLVGDAQTVREFADAENLQITDEEVEAQLELFNQSVMPLPEIASLFEDAGVELVPVVGPYAAFGREDSTPYLVTGFKYDLNSFLPRLGTLAPFSSLAEIIAANEEDLQNRAPYGQDYLAQSEATEVSEADFREQMNGLRQRAQAVINGILESNDVDALLGAQYAYPAAGFPAISIPMGYGETGQPVPLVLVGGYLSEPQLIQIAYALEQASQARVSPDLLPAIAAIDALPE